MHLVHSRAHSSHFRRPQSVRSPQRRKGVYGVTQTNQYSSSDESIDSGVKQSLRRLHSRLTFASERIEDGIEANADHSLQLDQHASHQRPGSKTLTSLKFNERSEKLTSTDADPTCAMRSFLQDSGDDSGQEIYHKGSGESIPDRRAAQNTPFAVGVECAALDESSIGMPVALDLLSDSGSLGNVSETWDRDTTKGNGSNWMPYDIKVRHYRMVWYAVSVAV